MVFLFSILLLSASLLYQNCGDNFKATQNSVLNSSIQEVNEEVDIPAAGPLDDYTLVSPVYSISLSGRAAKLAFFRKNSQSGYDLTLMLLDQYVSYPIALKKDPNWTAFNSNIPPQVVDINSGQSGVKILFMNRDGSALLMATFNGQDDLGILWILSTLDPVTRQDLVSSTSEMSNSTYRMTVGGNLIQNPDKDTASISCLPGFGESNGRCVETQRTCSIDNGTGIQHLEASGQYGTCQVQSCNMGHIIAGNSCVACNSDEHVENGACVSNTKSCKVANGKGEKTWQTNSYGQCKVTSCNFTFVKRNNACEPAPAGTIHRYVQYTGDSSNPWTAPKINSMCPKPLVPATCLSGENQEHDAAAAGIVYKYGTWGGPKATGGNQIVGGNGRYYCYHSSQKRDGDGSDLFVGIRCSNLANPTLTGP